MNNEVSGDPLRAIVDEIVFLILSKEQQVESLLQFSVFSFGL